jgi:hypothetical protein
MARSERGALVVCVGRVVGSISWGNAQKWPPATTVTPGPPGGANLGSVFSTILFGFPQIDVFTRGHRPPPLPPVKHPLFRGFSQNRTSDSACLHTCPRKSQYSVNDIGLRPFIILHPVVNWLTRARGRRLTNLLLYLLITKLFYNICNAFPPRTNSLRAVFAHLT